MILCIFITSYVKFADKRVANIAPALVPAKRLKFCNIPYFSSSEITPQYANPKIPHPSNTRFSYF